MRDLSNNKHTANVVDGDITHEIYYRKPGNKELANYQSSAMKRQGNKLIPLIAENRLTYGKKVLLGFKKGTFGLDGVAFSSEPGDPDYRVDWLDLLVSFAPDIVSAVGRHAFEGTFVSTTEDLEIGTLDEDDDPAPK